MPQLVPPPDQPHIIQLPAVPPAPSPTRMPRLEASPTATKKTPLTAKESLHNALGNIADGGIKALPKMLSGMWPLGVALVLILSIGVIARSNKGKHSPASEPSRTKKRK